MPGSVSSDAGSCTSQTSTELYVEHEPFETFQHRVRALCATLWPLVPLGAFTIEHMRGGTYNRVIGVTVPSTSVDTTPQDDEKYVLRVPRDDTIQIESELTTLCFIRDNTTIPVPEIVSFDLTCDNPIGSMYNIQPRIPGVVLEDVYMELSQAEKLSIICQFSQILVDMQKLRSPIPGLLGAVNCIDKKLVPGMRVVDFLTKTFQNSSGETVWGGMSDDTAKPKSTCQLLIDQFDGWQVFGRNNNRGEAEDELMERFRVVTRQMEQLGFLGGDDFVLFHWDFYSQNILVHKLDEVNEQESNQLGWKITGVLDWEGAAFTPYSVGCIPPTWIWCNWDEEEGRGEAELCETPEDPEARERKELFDSLMGVSYTDHAYSNHGRFVRRLFDFAKDGFYTSQQDRDAGRFFKDWDEFFKATLEGVQITPEIRTILEVRSTLEAKSLDKVEPATEVETTADIEVTIKAMATMKVGDDRVLNNFALYGQVFGARLRDYCNIQ